MHVRLERVQGPRCRICGCQDCDVHEWPSDGTQSWYAYGQATCRHCGATYAFQAAGQVPEPPMPYIGPPPLQTVTAPVINHADPMPLSTRLPVGPDVLSKPKPKKKPVNKASRRKIPAVVTICPKCGGKGLVLQTRGKTQYRKCRECDERYQTLKK